MTSRSFWPIASWIESPGFHWLSICQLPGSVLAVKARFRHSGVGSSPADSGPTSTPVLRPKPNFAAHACSGWPSLGGAL